MKVIQIIPQFGLAGAETMCENLSCALKDKHVEIVVISLYNYHSAITERIEKQGICIYYLNKKPGFDVTMFPKLIRIFKEEKADVIHTHLYAVKYAIPAAVLSGVKRRVHTVHNVAAKECSAYARKINGLFFKHLNVIPVALSPQIQKSILEEYRIKKERVPVIFNGINLSKCVPKTDYKSKNNIDILHIGRFSGQKNHFGLIRAFDLFHKKIRNSRLLLIGEGELKKDVEALVDELGLQNSVVFLGAQSDVYHYLHEADIFVLASEYEGMPMSLIEAMATGLPIISTAVGGIPDMIEDGENGILVTIREKDIAEALEQLSQDENMRKMIGTKAREKAVRYFSDKIMCENYYRIYENFI